MHIPDKTKKTSYRKGLYECIDCHKYYEAITAAVKQRGRSRCKICALKVTHKKCIKHGKTKERVHRIWTAMLQRCNNPNNSNYSRYGGRGIKVISAWLDATTFIEWALTNGYKDNLTINRINNDSDYCPNNCNWLTHHDQQFNRRLDSRNTTGYTGISLKNNKYRARISYNNNEIFIGTFTTIKAAVLARDQYIIKYNLPHKIQGKVLCTL